MGPFCQHYWVYQLLLNGPTSDYFNGSARTSSDFQKLRNVVLEMVEPFEYSRDRWLFEFHHLSHVVRPVPLESKFS